MDVRVEFGDSVLNSGRIIRLFAGAPVIRTFVQYLVAFSSPAEAASEVISSSFVGLTATDKSVKFRDPRLNPS